MKIMHTILTYSCGHEWREEYARGATKTEVKNAKAFASITLCPKCEPAEVKEYGT